jgi:hypothetical protein
VRPHGDSNPTSRIVLCTRSRSTTDSRVCHAAPICQHSLGDQVGRDYVLFRERVTWVEAVKLCPQRIVNSQLASVRSDADYAKIVAMITSEMSNPLGRTGTDIYEGAWIGLNAISATDIAGGPAPFGDETNPFNSAQAPHATRQTTPMNYGLAAEGWRWVDGVSYDGDFLDNAAGVPDTGRGAWTNPHWGPLGTGYRGCDTRVDIAGCPSPTIESWCETTHSSGTVPGNCAGGGLCRRKQPDNSGGYQRCAVLSIGGSDPPNETPNGVYIPPFYDDLRCEGCINYDTDPCPNFNACGVDETTGEGDDNHRWYICERKECNRLLLCDSNRHPTRTHRFHIP